MLPSSRSALFSALVLAAAPAAFAQAPAASALTRIGAAAAVSGKVLATAPSATVGRVVGSGKPIFLNDHVTTDPAGHLQVLLLDQTVFTLGPNSDMVLDEFVYDPNTNAGKLAANVVKGTFRFVSGHMAHEAGTNMKVRTPSGTMGIRGTIVLGQVSPQNTTFILAGPGANNNAGEPPGRIEVSNAGMSVMIDQPGYGTTVAGNNPPTPPVDMTAQLTQISAAVAPPPAKGSQQSSTNGTQGPTNATTAAGQQQAAAAQTANTTSEDVGSSQDAASVTTYASQDFANVIPDGQSSFDQIETAITNGVLLGTDQYSMSGTYSCSGGTCDGSSGSVTLNLVVDWAARTLGGNVGSDISLGSAGSFSGDSADISAVSFPATTGPASISFSNGDFSGATGNFDSMTVQLQNAGGVIAKSANASFTYSGSNSESISGSAAGSRAPYTVPPQ